MRFGRTVALAGVSLVIQPGRIHGVIGGDGAGKSTLLEVLAGLDIGRTGSERLPPPTRIGYVPSTGGAFTDLTVDENIEFVATTYGVAGWGPRAAALLERAGIARFGGRLAGDLSGGQRRKLAGCAALLHRPAMLVLDEVTTGVDPVSRMELWRLVAGAAAEGAAVVAATTYLDEAERMDHVLLLHRGRALASAPPRDIVAELPGCVLDLPQPSVPESAWRVGRRWRQWTPSTPAGGRRLAPSLEDAAIVLELLAGAERSEVGP